MYPHCLCDPIFDMGPCPCKKCKEIQRLREEQQKAMEGALIGGIGMISDAGMGPGAGMSPGAGMIPGAGMMQGADMVQGAGMTPGAGMAPGAGMVPGTGMVPGAGMIPGAVMIPGAGMIQSADMVQGAGRTSQAGNVSGAGMIPGTGMIAGAGMGFGGIMGAMGMGSSGGGGAGAAALWASNDPRRQSAARVETMNAFIMFMTHIVTLTTIFSFCIAVFWYTTCKEVYIMFKTLHDAGKDVRPLILAIVLLFVVVLASAWLQVRMYENAHPCSKPRLTAAQKKLCLEQNEDQMEKEAIQVSQMPSTRTDCEDNSNKDECAMRRNLAKSGNRQLEHQPVKNITNKEARQIFARSKQYAVVTEMKQPPSVLLYLRDLF